MSSHAFLGGTGEQTSCVPCVHYAGFIFCMMELSILLVPGCHGTEHYLSVVLFVLAEMCM